MVRTEGGGVGAGSGWRGGQGPGHRALRGVVGSGKPVKGEELGRAESDLLLKELPLAPCGGPAGGAETSDVDVAIVLASKDELRTKATAVGRE